MHSFLTRLYPKKLRYPAPSLSQKHGQLQGLSFTAPFAPQSPLAKYPQGLPLLSHRAQPQASSDGPSPTSLCTGALPALPTLTSSHLTSQTYLFTVSIPLILRAWESGSPCTPATWHRIGTQYTFVKVMNEPIKSKKQGAEECIYYTSIY